MPHAVGDAETLPLVLSDADREPVVLPLAVAHAVDESEKVTVSVAIDCDGVLESVAEREALADAHEETLADADIVVEREQLGVSVA